MEAFYRKHFFSRRQDGETLHEFSLELMSLMAPVRERAPYGMANADDLLCDQFVEHVLDGALQHEVIQYVRRQPMDTLLPSRARQSSGNERDCLGVVGVKVSLSHWDLVSSSGTKVLGGRPPNFRGPNW